ncbi:MAG: CRTAC1 family protein [Polyangiaceae bacterium]
MRTSLAGVLLAALVFLSIAGCKKDSGSVADASAPLRTDTTFLDDEAKRVLEKIAALEAAKDVTCWTSFRQLDSFISSNQYSSFAVIAKILAVKAMLRAAWERASLASAAATLTAADLNADAVVPLPRMNDAQKSDLASFATDHGMKAYKDYRTTSEHWRMVLSVITDEIAISGAGTNLKPLAPDALDAFAEIATRISLLMLQSAGELAKQERTPMIEAAHVKRVHETLSQKLGLVTAPRTPTKLPDAEIVARLAPLTETLIEGKIAALQTYNQDTKNLLTDLNRVTPKLPVTQEAIDIWTPELEKFTAFVAAGYDPGANETSAADGGTTPQTPLPYVSAARVDNITLQMFAHLILPNGDVQLSFKPREEDTEGPRKPFDELMLDYEQNAVRDTAWHWILLQDSWKRRAYAMDPFAAEYLSEVVSMMITHYLVRGAELAKEAKKTTIDAAIAREVGQRDYVMVMPRADQRQAWSPAQWAKKDALLAKYPSALFENVTAKNGLPTDVIPAPSSSKEFDVQDPMGSGLAVGDLNADGYPDFFVTGYGLGRLYLNKGKEAPGSFVDVTEAWKVPAALDDSRSALLTDFDGDGLTDLFIVRSDKPSLLLRQQNGAFVDVTSKVGIKTHHGAQSVQAFDFDRDGDLDIYIGYYGSNEANLHGGHNWPALQGRNGSPNQLWKRGADGSYTEVAAKAGVADVGWTLAGLAWDYDNDGDLDLFVANDFGASSLYQNRGDGTFADVSRISGTDERGSHMNASISDVDGDGFFDLYVSNLDMFSKNIKVVFPTDESTIKNIDANLEMSIQYLESNKLWMNPGDPKGAKAFTAGQDARFEPGDRGWGWASIFFDYENDGDEDIYLSNGWQPGAFAADQKKQMFLNDGGIFYLAPPSSPEAFASNGRSAVAVDIDRDGDQDLILSNLDARPQIFLNTQAFKNHWVGLRLRGTGANTRAIGARVTVTAGGKKQMRELSAGNGFLGQMDDVIYVGLGVDASPVVSVRFPNGVTKTVAVNVDAVNDVSQ